MSFSIKDAELEAMENSLFLSKLYSSKFGIDVTVAGSPLIKMSFLK